nr:hypothetical protein [Tanacetum cinerariifolium]
MVGGNGQNQFRQYAGQNVGNLNGYNDVQNVGNQVIQHAVQNPRIQNVIQGNANQNPNGNGTLVVARAEVSIAEHEDKKVFPKNRNMNQDSSRRTINVEGTASISMVAIDGAGFNWSYMADDEVLTNMALMAFSDFEGVGFVSYNVVPPPLTGLFLPPTLDLSNSGLEKFQQPEVEGYGPKISNNVSENISNEVKESLDASLVKELVNMAPRAILMKTGPRLLNTARPVNTAHPKTTVYRQSYLSVYKEINGGYVAFGGDPKGGKITGKGKISTDTEYVVLSPNFKLLDESQVLLRVPRKNIMYSVDLKNVAPSGGIENPIDHKVKIIKCDNGTKFKNKEMNQFCKKKGIKREFSVARTPQENGAEAVNTACYVQNRVLVIKPHNKTPYELFHGRTPSLSFRRIFGSPVTILNTLDPLGKFDGKADEGYFVEYFVNSKAFRVFNSRTRIVEETMHITFLENTPNVVGSRPTWLFDIDTLTKSINYKPVIVGNQSNGS